MKPNRYLIKDLENLTGIKAHTIRIWESRYQLLDPKRTDTNIRYYSESDLKKILNINLLYCDGKKISKIAKLSEEEIIAKAAEIVRKSSDSSPHDVTEIISAILDLNPEAIKAKLESLFAELGAIQLYNKTLVPLLVSIGELWQLNTLNITHEHLFSNTLREFILVKTSELPKKSNGKRALLFLPEHEEHEISLLFYQYLLKDMGWDCYYLGQNVPISELELSYNKINPDKVITSIISSSSSKYFRYIIKLMLDVVPKRKLCLSGSMSVTYKTEIPDGVNRIHNFADFIRIFG